MESTLTKHERNLAAMLHASAFSKFFIPFGNFIIPLVLWTANRRDYAFVDYNGKQVLNFQISLLLYSIVLGAISIPLFAGLFPGLLNGSLLGLDHLNDYNNLNIDFSQSLNLSGWLFPLGMAGLAHGALFVVNVVYTILAVIRTNEGQEFTYPLTIKFLK
ncbi:DUF4870 domain-containing protein [Zobellia galactanivorans]|uniref:Conserved Hypothetical membrane protein n=1 Tax=Zobellia galactanivorans (strain DSM 12802 / CCUG 47099 / CIP 106680 / NCIMB 13871 / Dsij) TaxID=63186 RepID=G0L099_ZOBGA|nr:DUF4870 domain-containing protein [Zobellia galactanivorans]MBU3027238.1 DUF4870 domain-containing protein [Zobellia galactanivorans]MDO6807831.1 DUF4870 domain-containing protein [Zobellia galactanivorans]CAZ94212.1 Conserved Hypothetical membrane protein [Zobellia galactanivorans]